MIRVTRFHLMPNGQAAESAFASASDPFIGGARIFLSKCGSANCREDWSLSAQRAAKRVVGRKQQHRARVRPANPE